MIAESSLDRGRLSEITQRCRRSVSVYIRNLLSIETGIADSVTHALVRAAAVGCGCGDVPRVAAHAEADEFGEDGRAAFLRTLVFFEQQTACAIAQDEAVAIAIPGATRSFGFVVARRERACRREAADPEFRRGIFGTTGEHDVGIVVGDETCREPDAVS